jgi:predicted GNAT family N-acyltransferase
MLGTLATGQAAPRSGELGYNSGMTPPVPAEPRLRRARFAELTPFEVYGLCRLRVDVFVVEQECPYPELDGRDLEPGTRHVWLGDGDEPIGYLRVLDDGDHARIEAALRRASADGFVGELRDAVDASLARSAKEEIREIDLLQDHLHDDVAEFVYERLRRRPMILPVVVEV